MLLKIRHALLEVNNSKDEEIFLGCASNSNYRCSKQSAIIINSEFILTTANVLQEFIIPKDPQHDFDGGEWRGKDSRGEIIELLKQFEMIPPRKELDKDEQQTKTKWQESLESLEYLITFDVVHNKRRIQTLDEMQSRQFVREEGHFLGLFHSSEVYNQLLKLSGQQDDCGLLLSSSFLLLTTRNHKGQSKDLQEKKHPDDMKRFLEHIHHYLRQMHPIRCLDDILVIGSPFGLEGFYKTINFGKISNILDDSGCIFMLSNPLTVGCEGSAVFNDKLRLIGIVICTSFSHSTENRIQLTLATNLNNLLRRFLQYFGVTSRHHSIKVLKGVLQDSTTFNWENSVVMIDHCGQQGSGTLIKVHRKRYILTCAHVVFQATSEIVCRSRDRIFRAKVLWHNPYFDTAFDIALLQIDESSGHEIPDGDFKRLEVTHCVVGQRIYNAGYPYFSPSSRDTLSDVRPAIFEGRIIKCHPSQLITDGLVQSGQSGGPMFDENGRLVGISVSNIKWKSQIYPKLNSAVPVAAIATTIKEYSRNGDKKVLHGLIAPESIQRMWSLKRPQIMTLSKL